MIKKQTIEKLDPKTDGASPDLVADNIEMLREIFPEVFADGRIDFDALKQTLGEYVDDRDERYSFTWHGKARARQIAQMPSTGTLRPCPEESVNWDTTKNIFIEGDNLEVLKLLQKSYHRKVKMIYIDPPYNTGKEFIYPDKWQDNLDTYLRYTGQVDDEGFKLSANSETSGRYHTNWLNMMYPRLKLARNLLRDDGVFLVSIDDNEVANLRRLCDEIFGEENYLATFVIRSTPNARTYGHVGKMHDYCIMYAKLVDATETYELEEESKEFKYRDGHGPFNIHPQYNSDESFHRGNRPNLYYPIYISPSSCDSDGFCKISVDKIAGFYIEVYPPKSKNGLQFVWRFAKETSRESVDTGIVGFKKNDGSYRVVRKMRHTSRTIRSMLLEKEFSNRRGTAEVESLFGRKAFSFPKPLALLEILLQVTTVESDIVIDFFAGSATFGHAVWRANTEDGANRRYLLVQLPEPVDSNELSTLADIAKERLRLAAKEMVEDRDKTLPGVRSENTDLGFKVFKLASSNIKPWDAEFDTLEQDLLASVDNIKSDRSEDDVLYELLLKYGLDLAIPTETRTIEGRKVTIIGAGALIVCLAADITLEVVSGIAALKAELQPEVMRVVFKDSGFADDVVKTNAAQILRQAGIDDVKSL